MTSYVESHTRNEKSNVTGNYPYPSGLSVTTVTSLCHRRCRRLRDTSFAVSASDGFPVASIQQQDHQQALLATPEYQLLAHIAVYPSSTP